MTFEVSQFPGLDYRQNFCSKHTVRLSTTLAAHVLKGAVLVYADGKNSPLGIGMCRFLHLVELGPLR